ncbi:MAG: ATP-binding cassette domain-containing protein, partial [Bacteroidales bacterium]
NKFAGFYPSQLSGGMKQRVSLARAFCYPADVILMDEPFTGLDMGLRQNLIRSFQRIWESHPRTVLFVTHNLEEALQMGQYIYVLSPAPACLIMASENTADKQHFLKEQILALIDLPVSNEP